MTLEVFASIEYITPNSMVFVDVLIPWSHPMLPNPFTDEPVRELQGSLVVMIAVAGALGNDSAAVTD